VSNELPLVSDPQDFTAADTAASNPFGIVLRSKWIRLLAVVIGLVLGYLQY